MEGRRALVTEVQALVGAIVAGSPRRTVSGLDSARLSMVLAVLQSRSGLRLHEREIFAATVGGIRVVEPAADLGLALAVASAANDFALAADLVAIGEVGLTGEVRRVGAVAGGWPRRPGSASGSRWCRRAAARPVPARSRPACEVVEVPTVRAALNWAVQHSEKPPDDDRADAPPLPVTGQSRRIRRLCGVPIDREGPLRATLALVAPGTALRDGLERILRGRTGALIVLGHDKAVEGLCTGGFPLDVEFSSTRLRELCKMDGAVVLSSDGTRIVRAAVHLMPDSTIPTEESGTRHRTAERVAKQTGHPVISVSQSMHIIGLYVNGTRHVIDDSAAILSRANQALATLERYKLRLDEVSGTLSALEIEDLVTARDAIAVVQRLEMVRRIADEIEGYVVELGTDGRLLALQLDELMAGVDSDRTLVIRDYLPSARAGRVTRGGAGRAGPRHGQRADRPGRGGQGDRLPEHGRRARRRGLAARLPAAGQGAAAARPRSWTGWSSTSAACSGCSAPRSRTCRRSRASATRAPAACARACPGWPRRRSWSGTSEPRACARPPPVRSG